MASPPLGPTAPPDGSATYLRAAVGASLFWSWLVFVLRWVQGASPIAILALRMILAAALFWGAMLLFQRARLQRTWAHLQAMPRPVRRGNLWRMCAGGAITLLNWSAYIYVVNAVNLRTASFAYLTNPVLVAVLGFLLLRERLSRVQWGAVALAAASCGVLGRESVAEVGYSLAVSGTYALFLLTQRPVQIDRLVLAGVHFAVGAVLLLPLAWWWAPQVPMTASFWAVMALMAGIFTIIPQALNLYALQGLTSGQLAMLGYLLPILVFLYGIGFYGERPSVLQWGGYAALLIALAIFNWDKLRRQLHLAPRS